jgi:CHAD domain-containing protein
MHYSTHSQPGTQFKRAALRHIEIALDVARDSDGEEVVERIHDIRVCCKRLRAFWQALRPVLDPAAAHSADGRVRAIAQLLATQRDAHVIGETLHMLEDDSTTPAEQAVVRTARDAIRATPYAATVPDTPPWPAIAALLEDELATWQSLPDDLDHDRIITEGICRTYRKAREYGLASRETTEPEAWHRWRKWVKYLLFQVEVMREGSSSFWLPRHSARLAKLGSRLGDLHDVQMTASTCQIAARLPEGQQHVLLGLSTVAERSESRLRARCENLGSRLFAHTPEVWIELLRRHRYAYFAAQEDALPPEFDSELA